MIGIVHRLRCLTVETGRVRADNLDRGCIILARWRKGEREKGHGAGEIKGIGRQVNPSYQFRDATDFGLSRLVQTLIWRERLNLSEELLASPRFVVEGA